MKSLFLFFAMVASSVSGCGDDSSPSSDSGADSRAAGDASIDAAPDGSLDATPSADSGRDSTVGDTGSDLDSAPPPDGAPVTDSGPESDAGRTCVGSFLDCGAGYYCHTPDGMCAGRGLCEAFDSTAPCPGVAEPVCGCDGVDYRNACEALRAGQAVDHAGSCEMATTCHSDVECRTGDFCELAAGSCGGTGVCTSRGIMLLCAMICTPECGCDGETYENPCLRRKAGMSLGQVGVCPGGPPPCAEDRACCATGATCLVGQECVGAHPGSPGRCVPIPAAPDCWQDDDCGAGRACRDPFICPCGETCPRPDAIGTCF